MKDAQTQTSLNHVFHDWRAEARCTVTQLNNFMFPMLEPSGNYNTPVHIYYCWCQDDILHIKHKKTQNDCTVTAATDNNNYKLKVCFNTMGKILYMNPLNVTLLLTLTYW